MPPATERGAARPTVSVVIPAYNAAPFIDRAIRSALNQTHEIAEVIVVDDASVDSTVEVVERLCVEDQRVKLVRLLENGGPSTARNVGFAAATGEWIAVLDADDAYLRDRLSHLMAKSDEADILADNMLSYDPATDSRRELFGWKPDGWELIDLLTFADARRKHHDFGLFQPVFRRQFLEKHKLRYPEDVRHGEDYLLAFEAIARGARYWLSWRPGYLYTTRNSGWSRTQVDYAAMGQQIEALAKRADLDLPSAVRAKLIDRVARISELDARHRLIGAFQERRVKDLLALAARNPPLWPLIVVRVCRFVGKFLYWRAHRVSKSARDWVVRRLWEARALVRGQRPRRGKRHNLRGELIVSLTSYPPRFPTLHLTLACLLDQTVRPDRVILWIAHDDRKLLPKSVARLERRGLEIRTCDDLRSYKKLIPALEAFPDAFVATADDDIYYPSDWLEELVEGVAGSTIICHRAHRLVRAGGKLTPYRGWDFDVQDKEAREPSTDLVPTGVGGILYPPRSLHPLVTDRALFQALCRDGDDLWFYWCARMTDTSVRKVGSRMRLVDWEGTRDTALWNSNAIGGNDKMIAALQARFPLSGPAFKSAHYWEKRYIKGGTSGAGSYNRLAEFKARILNDFVEQNDIRSIIEFGSGDGAQLELAKYPSYVGVDVSRTVVGLARERFRDDPSKQFFHVSEVPEDTRAELSLSLDVIYHLVEDDVFDDYMRRLFDAATRFAIVYSSNCDDPGGSAEHVRHRCFTRWVESERPDFAQASHIPNEFPFDENDQENTSFADFYIFRRSSGPRRAASG